MSENAKKNSINRDILKLALPAIFNNITVPLLGLSDTTISGHLGSSAYLGAMAVGTMMLNVIFWLCGFLRAGSSGLTANALGANDFALTRNVLKKSLTIGFAIAAIVIILQIPILKLLIFIINPDSAVAVNAELYFKICIWGAPAQLGIMAVTGWFIGLQNTVVPMIVAVGVNVVNILLSVLLVFVWDFGFKGIACGTLCANWIGLIAALLFVWNKWRKLPPDSHRSVVKWSRFFSVNSNLFLRSACIMLVTLAITSAGARMGEVTLAANAVMMQFFMFFSYFMDGFAYAGEAIVGKAYGAKDYMLLRLSVRGLLRWGAIMALSFFIIYLFGTEFIASLLTDQTPVLNVIAGMKWWVILLPPITVAAFLYDGIYIGMAHTKVLMMTTLIAAAIFFSIAIIGGGGSLTRNNTLLWGAFEAYLLARGALLALKFRQFQRKSLSL